MIDGHYFHLALISFLFISSLALFIFPKFKFSKTAFLVSVFLITFISFHVFPCSMVVEGVGQSVGLYGYQNVCCSPVIEAVEVEIERAESTAFDFTKNVDVLNHVDLKALNNKSPPIV